MKGRKKPKGGNADAIRAEKLQTKSPQSYKPDGATPSTLSTQNQGDPFIHNTNLSDHLWSLKINPFNSDDEPRNKKFWGILFDSPENRSTVIKLFVATTFMFLVPMVTFVAANEYFKDVPSGPMYSAICTVVSVNVTLISFIIYAFCVEK